jgi:hypothetical protein
MNNIKEFVPKSIYYNFLCWFYPDVERAAFVNSYSLIDADNMFGQATVDCYFK